MIDRRKLKKTTLLPHLSKQAQKNIQAKAMNVLSYFVQSGDLGQILHRVCLVLIAVRGHECLGGKMSDN